MDAGGDQMSDRGSAKREASVHGRKIFVAGATGVLGRRAVRDLVRAGHDVTGVARSAEKAALLRDLGVTPATIDPFDAAALNDMVSGHDVVMNLATHIPPLAKSAFPSAWKENDRIRSELSNLLVDAAIAAGATRYVQEAIAFTYEDRGERWIDEDTPLETAQRVAAVRDAERAAARFTDSGGVGVVLRFGMFYASDTDHTEIQLKMARRGISPFPGSPGDYVSVIHLDDAGTAVVAALEVPAGTYNVVDDEPLTRAEVGSVFAGLVGRQKLMTVPKAVTSVGGAAMRMMSRSQRVSNERFKKASGWEPRLASAREGLPVVVAEMTASGG
jgi:nucleoside-diphosphate-sugar epimerase